MALPRSSASQSETLLVILLIVFVLLAATYSFVVPIYEAPDEPEHVAKINYLYTNHSLGNPGLELVPLGIEPPLYHATLAFFMYLTHSGPVSLHLQHIGAQFPAHFVHSDAEQNYGRPEYNSIHALRLLSILFSLGTIVATERAGRLLFSDPYLPLFAAAMTAFIPQFVFMSSVISYDSLANFLAAVSFLFVLKLLSYPKFSKKDAAFTGLFNGLALLAKVSNFLVPLITTAGFILKFSTSWVNRRRLLEDFLIVVAVMLVVSGWFLVRDQLKFGNPIGWTFNPAFRNPNAGFGGEPKTILSPYFTSGYFSDFVFNSFWLTFGWMTVQGPVTLYTILKLFVIVGVVGVCCSAFFAYRGAKLKFELLTICGFFVILTLSAIVYYNLSYSQPQGRYMFPTLSAISLLTIEGLSWVSQRTVKRLYLIPGALVFFLFLVNLFALPWLPTVYR